MTAKEFNAASLANHLEGVSARDIYFGATPNAGSSAQQHNLSDSTSPTKNLNRSEQSDINWTERNREALAYFCGLCEILLDKGEIETIEILNKRGLLTDSGKRPFFTIDGALLFAPSERLPNGFCTDVRIENMSVKPPLIKNYHGKCLAELLKELNSFLSILWQDEWEDPAKRDNNGLPVKVRSYPQTAIIEALVNFIIHRNYEILDQAFITITNEYVKFVNPGISSHCPDELLTINEPLRPKYNRNENIIFAISRTNLNQLQGGGIIRIREALLQNGNLKENSELGLEIENDDAKNRFSLVIYKRQNFFNRDVVYENISSGDITGRDIHIHNYYAAEVTKEEITIEVDLFHLPNPTTALIGRKAELAQLTEAFNNGKTRLAIIVAAGGIGKSALIDEWLQQIAQENYYGKTRVFGWSFYSIGSHSTFTNSQSFFSAVLPFLDISDIPKDEIEKARLLARCLQQQPCLLILDGLEPLQYTQNLATMNGELQDSALKEFIACFRQTAGKSFVLFSSRQPLVELKKWQAEHYLSLDLKTLPHQDGAELLQSLGVMGKTAERQAISQNLNGHALSLVLMGHLLSEYHQGDCRYAKELPPLTLAHGDSDAEKDGRHALRVLDYYDSLQDVASRCFLQLLGLFDRPMNWKEKEVLIANADYAEPLRNLTAKQWQVLEQQLEKNGLLLDKKGSFERLEWDTHPIIRSYFGQKFKENHPEAFKQAHLVLFDYYQKLPEKELPDTLEEMQPLYRAVVHGCLAEKYQQALEEVYYQRILRSDEYYSWYKLGAYLQDLTALSAFFPFGWSEVVKTGLTETTQAWLLANVSFCLMSLGRLIEAIAPRLADLKMSEKLEAWGGAARSAQNLVDLYLPLGQINLAYTNAQLAVDYAQKSGDNFSQVRSKSYLATVLYRSGRFNESFNHFQQAETLGQQCGYQYLSSIYAFQYCSLLLESAKDKATLQIVETRAKYILELFIKQNHLISIALDYLNLARVHDALNETSQAGNYFQLAIQGIQKANTEPYIPPFYLYRADFYLTQNQLDPAQADLNSAWEIIERCGMKLYAVDYLIIHGRYSLATADFDTALNHYDEAKQLIQETGYHLRDAELYLFAAQICRSTKQTLHAKTAEDYLQKAKNRIEEIGQWGLMRVIERDFP